MSDNIQHPQNRRILEQRQLPDDSTQSKRLKSLLDQANDLLLAPTPDFSEQSILPPSTSDKDLLSWLTWGGGDSSSNRQCNHNMTTTEEITNVDSTVVASKSNIKCNSNGNSCSEVELVDKDQYEATAIDWAVRVGSISINNCDGDHDGSRGFAVLERRKGGSKQKSSCHSDVKRKKATVYERKRRKKINEKMSNLAKLMPTTRKNDDKVLLLDKAIEHIKLLQENQNKLMMMSSNTIGAANPNSMVAAAPQFLQLPWFNNQIFCSPFQHPFVPTASSAPPFVFLQYPFGNPLNPFPAGQ